MQAALTAPPAGGGDMHAPTSMLPETREAGHAGRARALLDQGVATAGLCVASCPPGAQLATVHIAQSTRRPWRAMALSCIVHPATLKSDRSCHAMHSRGASQWCAAAVRRARAPAAMEPSWHALCLGSGLTGQYPRAGEHVDSLSNECVCQNVQHANVRQTLLLLIQLDVCRIRQTLS